MSSEGMSNSLVLQLRIIRDDTINIIALRNVLILGMCCRTRILWPLVLTLGSSHFKIFVFIRDPSFGEGNCIAFSKLTMPIHMTTRALAIQITSL